ncbi:MAG: glycosyltransferase [Candidatus Bathyarchaeia archaeon]
MKPKITIGVCVKDGEHLIEYAIKSILGQDYPHELMQVIFVDDGSTDKTLSIIKSYAPKMDMKVQIFHHKWKGLGYSRNIVINNAEGDFILWVDGDMVLSKDFVSKLVKFMEQHPKVGIAKGKQAFEPGGNLLATLEAYSRAVSRMVDYQSENARLKSLGTGGAIYRLEATRQIGGFDKNLKGYGEDFDIEIRFRKNGWLLATTNAYFLDYERCGLTWKNLWWRYWLRGYYLHYFSHKNKGFIKHYRMFPPSAFVLGFLHAKKLFQITRKKMVFLLPLQYLYKATAWYFGFIRSHMNGYAPEKFESRR